VTAALRLVPADASTDPALRPTCFDDYVGQAAVVAQLRGAVRAARRGGWQLDHVLLAGPPGLGKTTLAQVVANELGARLHATSAPAVEHRGQLASLLTSLSDGDVLFIDEIHALDRAIAEILYSALEDRVLDMPAGKKVIRVPLPKFTLVAATTHAGKLPAPLRDRFGLALQLAPYAETELAQVVARAARLINLAIEPDGCAEVARRSRGVPRIANKLLRRVRDYAENGCPSVRNGVPIEASIVAAALDATGVDARGLGDLDRRYLAAVADRPIGLDALAAQLGEDRRTLEDAIEPHLIQAGLVRREARGRVATDAGRAHLVHLAQPQVDDFDDDAGRTMPQIAWEGQS
jgi:holliday junction DNA helicase RuvB